MEGTKANDIQHGGDHYKGADYQHWDFVTDIRLSYLLAVATKYISRWRKKGGLLDLQKAGHYIDKAIEVGAQSSSVNGRFLYFWRFAMANNITLVDGAIIFLIMEGQLEEAKALLGPLLDEAQNAAS